jgi:hypothetical protein
MSTPQPIVPAADPAGPVPTDNVPGHHPEVEQDKPTRAPRPKARPAKAKPASVPDPARFDFEFDPRFEAFDRLLGVTRDSAFIEVAGDRVTVRFGRWVVETTRDNVVSAEATGPYAWWKVAGPPHLSFVDRGLTFATTTERGVCIRLREPVSGIEPLGLLRHPGLTVTPRDPDGLVEALTR